MEVNQKVEEEVNNSIQFENALRYVGLMGSLFLEYSLVFEWYMTRLLIKDGHQEDTYCNGLWMCAQKIEAF